MVWNLVFNAFGHKFKDMTKEELSRANNLSDFIEAYGVVINRYCNGATVNENRLGCALIDINKYAPKESTDIKNAIKKALNSIQKEFDEL
jgi:hypothetical protein